MQKIRASIILGCLCLTLACSPRDFLTRSLAAELIAASDTFKTTQRFWLHTGAVSNKDYLSPEYLVLQHKGWITGSNMPCPAGVTPPPCWDVVLTPLGVETFRNLMPENTTPSNYFSVPAARRELVEVTGISKGDQLADVEFTWKWAPMNEVGTALYGNSVEFSSTVGFRHYDDGWRLIEGGPAKSYQTMEDALKGSEPSP